MVSQICAQLPECIRVFAIKKTTNGFNSKIACDGRTYVGLFNKLQCAQYNY